MGEFNEAKHSNLDEEQKDCEEFDESVLVVATHPNDVPEERAAYETGELAMFQLVSRGTVEKEPTVCSDATASVFSWA